MRCKGTCHLLTSFTASRYTNTVCARPREQQAEKTGLGMGQELQITSLEGDTKYSSVLKKNKLLQKVLSSKEDVTLN